MGFIVEADENEHGIAFAIRRESVIFYLSEPSIEISKDDLVRLYRLLSDPKWGPQLLIPKE